jgi:hypothetical protein
VIVAGSEPQRRKTMMMITPQTTVYELITAYPFLVEEFTERYPKFAALNNPAMRAMVARVATLERVADVVGVPVSKFLQDVAEIIRRRTVEEVTQDVAEIPRLEGENSLLD